MSDAVEVERDLEVLLKEEDRFEPSEEFVKQANFSDPSVYDEAEKDFEAWWERWPRSSTGSSRGRRSSSGTRPGPSGSRRASSTPRTTASTGTSTPARATRSPITGSARTATRAT